MTTAVKSAEEMLIELIEPTEFFDFVGWDMKRRGRNYRGSCPFHDGQDENFIYVADKQFFYCHSHCHCGFGNYVNTYAKAKQIPRRKALMELAKWKGVSIQGRPQFSPRPPTVEKKVQEEKQKELIDLPIVSKEESKGLFPLEAHPRFPFEVIQRFQLKEGRFGRYRNRIVFPIHDIKGRYVGNNGRWEGNDYKVKEVPKYLYSQAPFLTRYILYGAHLVLDAPEWILHEGVTDTIKAYEHGYQTVSIFGSSLSEEQVELLRQHPKPIILGLDGDEVGKKGTKKAIERLKEYHLTNVYVMPIPEGKDPGSLTKEEYDQAYQQRMNALVYYGKYLKDLK